MAVGSGIQRQWNVSVAYGLQTDLGVPFTGAGAHQLPLTGGRGNMTMDSIPSIQVRQDGMTVRGRHGTQKTKGDYKGELQQGNYDPIFESVMRGTFAGGGTLGGSLLTNPPAGQLVRRYWTIEEFEYDLQQSEVYYDCVWDMFEFTMKPNGMIDLNTSWIGTGNVTGQSQTVGTAPPLLPTPTFPTTNAIPMASLDAELTLSDLGVVLDLTAFTLKVDLKAVAPPVAGSRFSPDVFDGVMQIGGTMTIMRRNLQPFIDAIAETSISMSFTTTIPGSTTPLYRFTVPFFTYSAAEKSEFKRDGGPLTVTIPFPDALVGIDTTGGANPATMFQIERST